MQYGPLVRRFQAFPLRTKLTLWNTFVMLLVSVVALVAVREGLRWMLLKELEISLEDEVYEIALNVHRTSTTPEAIIDEMERTSAGHVRHGWFLQVFDAEGRSALWSSDNTPDAFRRELPASSRGRSGSTLTPQGDYRFAERRLEVKGLPQYVVRIGTSLDFINEDVVNVTRIMTPVLIGVFLLAPLGGYLLAGRATAPLQRIISTTRRLHPSRLSERLSIRETGDELDQLSAEINNFLDQIADHLQRNREFVANAAHELRSPLSAIIASIDVALSRSRPLDAYLELLTTIDDECRQLTTLVNQLLLLAESDAGLLRESVVPVGLDEVTATAVEMFAGVADEKGVTLTADVERGVTVRGDALRLRQVVNNLIDNAIKFTPSGGRVEATVKRTYGHGAAVLTVHDTGMGIPDDALPYVFDRFYQVERSRHHDDVIHGTGLGLSICKAIVTSYGGTIDAASEPGRGTTFTVTLPSFAAAKVETMPQEAASRPRDTVASGLGP